MYLGILPTPNASKEITKHQCKGKKKKQTIGISTKSTGFEFCHSHLEGSTVKGKKMRNIQKEPERRMCQYFSTRQSIKTSMTTEETEHLLIFLDLEKSIVGQP